MHRLTVYISSDCWSCEETLHILDEITPEFPKLLIELKNSQQEPLPEGVFAVPTYLLDDEIFSLGNPTRKALRERLSALFFFSG